MLMISGIVHAAESHRAEIVKLIGSQGYGLEGYMAGLSPANDSEKNDYGALESVEPRQAVCRL